jgi:hypothetical protein
MRCLCARRVLSKTQFLDARYSWCSARSLSRAAFGALSGPAFAAAAGGARLAGRAAFVEADLLEARGASRL